MTESDTGIIWFRSDLRLTDNAALNAALDQHQKVIAVYILDEQSNGLRPLGGAMRWWLHHSLVSLANDINSLGGTLVLRRGDAMSVLDDLISETNAKAVYWNRRYDAPEIALDSEIKSTLSERGISAISHAGHLLHEPSLVQTKTGGPYRVYTPFWRAFSEHVDPRPPLKKPTELKPPASQPVSDTLKDWNLLPTRPDWSGGMAAEWTPGETGARGRLETFLINALDEYKTGRDFPASSKTSKLSPHLRFGEISPYQIWHESRRFDGKVPEAEITTFRKEIVWREFAYHLLFHYPHIGTKNYNTKFDAFPWRDDPSALAAWQKGMTGYPIVDAGMRELWQTGWMHNRVRMIVGSFLVKHLLLDWREGEAWFWNTLVDGDPASNTASWQWIAGSGADAAPYFRIFNPMGQSEKFDGDGDYIRRFVPELAKLSDKSIHRPWEAGALELSAAGIELGKTYPEPIIDHRFARERALAAFQSTREIAE